MKLGIRMAALFLAGAGGLAAAQDPGGKPQPPRIPDFRLQIWGDALADFSGRMAAYAELRRTLQQGIPVLSVTDDPVEIKAAETALARRIRTARARAGKGAIFSGDIRAAFRRVLSLETNDATCAAVLDENPGQFAFRVNGDYPKAESMSTVPPGILAALPELPPDVNYRFIGRDLILHDTRANIVLDELDDAIRCF